METPTEKLAILRESKAGWQDGGLFPKAVTSEPPKSIMIPESMRDTRQSQILHRAQITDGGSRPRP